MRSAVYGLCFFAGAVLAPLAAQSANLAEDARTGAYKDEVTLEELFGDQFGDVIKDALPPDYDISFQLYAPPDYDPARPAGVLTYVSPTRSGKPPQAWTDVFSEHNLIWVSVNGSGNRQQAYKRIIEALSSLKYVADRYNIDPDRRYLSGFSGGGRISSILAGYYPEYFTGVIYMAGVNSLKDIPQPELETMKKTRFVFMTGSRDFNRAETKQIYQEYERAGFERIKLIDDLGRGHSAPSAARLEEAIIFLDLFAARSEKTRADDAD